MTESGNEGVVADAPIAPGIPSARQRPGLLWWAYFMLLVGLTLLGFLFTGSPLDVAYGIFDAVGLIGLWGWLRQVAIGWRAFWACYLALTVLFSLLEAAIGFFGASPPDFQTLVLGLCAIVLLLSPLYVALWRYAFRSDSVWVAAGE